MEEVVVLQTEGSMEVMEEAFLVRRVRVLQIIAEGEEVLQVAEVVLVTEPTDTAILDRLDLEDRQKGQRLEEEDLVFMEVVQVTTTLVVEEDQVLLSQII